VAQRNTVRRHRTVLDVSCAHWSQVVAGSPAGAAICCLRVGLPRSIVQPFCAGFVSVWTTVISEDTRFVGAGIPSVAIQFLRRTEHRPLTCSLLGHVHCLRPPHQIHHLDRPGRQGRRTAHRPVHARGSPTALTVLQICRRRCVGTTATASDH
jgi:hypothetical protein